jgi:hypothetical protein
LAKNKVKAVEWIQQSFLSDELKEDYLELLEVRYQLFIANCDTQY